MDWNFIFLFLTAIGGFGIFICEVWFRVIAPYRKERIEEHKTKVKHLKELDREMQFAKEFIEKYDLSHGWGFGLPFSTYKEMYPELKSKLNNFFNVSHDFYVWYETTKKVAKLIIWENVERYLKNTEKTFNEKTGIGYLRPNFEEKLINPVINHSF